MAYDEGYEPPPPRPPFLKRLVQKWSAWAWADVLDKGEEAMTHYRESRQIAVIKTLQLSLLEELFREKQAKITRLQSYHIEHRRPMYEDLRKENPIKDAESLAQSIDVLARRAEAYMNRTGKHMRISDGTVLGVPGDKPNVETGDSW